MCGLWSCFAPLHEQAAKHEATLPAMDGHARPHSARLPASNRVLFPKVRKICQGRSLLVPGARFSGDETPTQWLTCTA